MKRFFVPFLVLFICLGLVTSLEARDDWEYWGKVSFKTALHDAWDLKFENENRLREDFGTHYVTNLVGGVIWKPLSFLNLGFHYKYEYAESNTTGKNTDEHRPYLDVALKDSFRRLKISNRYRLERRFLTDSGFWRHRNEVKLAYPLTLAGSALTPFVSEEIFYDDRQEQFNQNRLTFGFSKKLTKQLGIDLFYRIKSSRGGNDWSEAHILGSSLNVSF